MASESKKSHLPMSETTISVVQATAPVVAPLAHKITETFYPILFRDYPAALDFFNKTNQKKGLQSGALGDAVVAYASNIDNLGVLAGAVKQITNRHCALGVTPDLYAAVHASMMKAIVEVLGDAVTPEIGEAWSNAVLALAEICWTTEEETYKAAERRKGGWRMFREFELVKKTRVGEDTVSFDFKAGDGYADGFEYDAGQYLTIKLTDGETKLRRHYTVTSNPGDPLLQCTTRLVKGKDGAPDGAVSSFMHSEKFAVGTRVELSAPFGGYSAKGLGLKRGAPVAFVTAGIGATPAIALSGEGFVGVRGALHVDRCAGYGQGVVDKIDANIAAGGCDAKVKTIFGEHDHGKVAERITEFGSSHKDCDFICCGPKPFMKSARKALGDAGVEDGKIHCEMFGTGNVDSSEPSEEEEAAENASTKADEAALPTNPENRIERDSFGPLEVPGWALYGAQTARALRKFDIGTQFARMPLSVVRGFAVLKKCAALYNSTATKKLNFEIAWAIAAAADEVLAGQLDDHFPLAVFQTGSGTQTNANVNEVLSNKAIQMLGGVVGSKDPVHPDDHCNMGQSSNEIFPAAMHIAAVTELSRDLIPALEVLEKALAAKSGEFQVFSGYAAQIRNGISRVRGRLPGLSQLALGGTEAGYASAIAKMIADETGLPFTTAPNKSEALAADDAIVEASGALNVVACSLNKIANDLRSLGTNGPGPSIVPGKVDPAQCEAVTMVAAQVMGNHVTISFGGAGGNFERNVFKPVMVANLLQSCRLIADASRSFSVHCVEGLAANEEGV